MVKKLLRYMSPYWPYALLCPIFMVLEVVSDVVIPIVMAQIVDVAFPSGDQGLVIGLGLRMILYAFIGLFFGATSTYLGAKAGMGFAANIRKATFERIQSFSFAELDKFSVPSLVTRLTSDINLLGQTTMMSLRMAIRSPVMMVMAMFMAIRLNADLAMIFLFALPILAIAVFTILRNVHPLFIKLQKKVDDLNRTVRENITGIRVVKAFNRQDYEEKQFADKNDGLRDMAIRAMSMVIAMMPIMAAIVYACIMAVLWFGGHSVVQGMMGTGELISFITYIGQIMMSLMMMSMYFMQVTRASASLERVSEVLATETAISSPDQGAVTHVADGSIRFRDVDFAYSETSENALHDVNIEIGSGETIGILGPTGSAKTSLVQLIPRLYDVKNGYVQVGGVNVKDYDLKTLRDKVAFVLQKNTLFSGTIRSNMLWGNEEATDNQIVDALKAAQAWEFVSKYPDGLDHPVEQGGANFSGGQRQRLTIARALLKEPKIIILDDSTSAVDTATDAKIQETFSSALSDVTKIIIAQRISSIESADRIIVMRDGRVESMGTHEDLLASSNLYRETYESQEGVLAQ